LRGRAEAVCPRTSVVEGEERVLHEISMESITYRFDRAGEPCVRVRSGDRLRVHTRDAHSGTVDTREIWKDVAFPELDDSTGNPVTGPVYIEEAEPGATLKVEILEIKPDETGILPVRSYMGVLRDIVEQRTARVVRYHRKRLWISAGISVPARPMIGTIGVAAQGESVAAAYPGSHGGNLDDNYICEKSTVFLPIYCKGALFALGDVHAAMGDGELTCGGADIDATVLVRVDVLEEAFPLDNPFVVKDGFVATHGFAPTYEDSAAMASTEMKKLLCMKMNVSEYEAVLLMATRGDLGLCQACRCHVPMIVRMAFPILW